MNFWTNRLIPYVNCIFLDWKIWHISSWERFVCECYIANSCWPTLWPRWSKWVSVNIEVSNVLVAEYFNCWCHFISEWEKRHYWVILLRGFLPSHQILMCCSVNKVHWFDILALNIFPLLDQLYFSYADVEADNTPAFDAVLKADTKRLALLEEVCSL